MLVIYLIFLPSYLPKQVDFKHLYIDKRLHLMKEDID
jgi:hypothetical protein